MYRQQSGRGAVAVLILSVSLSVLCGCHSDTTASTNPVTATQGAAPVDSNVGGAVAPATANPAEYNKAISPEQRNKIQSHKDGL
jgi:hypothetical protein